MKTWSKKMASVAIAALLLGSTNLHCEEGKNNDRYQQFSLYDPSENADNRLFVFMRESQILWSLSQIAIGMKDLEQLEKIVALPFLDLHEQLTEKLNALVEAEEVRGASKTTAEDWKTIVDWKKEIKATPCCATEEGFERRLKSLYDSRFQYNRVTKVQSSNMPPIDYQNNLDELSLNQAYKYDVQQRLSRLYAEEDFAQKEALLKEVIEHSIVSYEKFIEANKNTFEKIKAIANNGFKVKRNVQASGNPDLDLFNEEHAEEIYNGLKIKREIEFKSLSEVMIYAKLLQKEEESHKSEL